MTMTTDKEVNTDLRTHGYEAKNIKTFMGMDVPGFNCTLYRDGKRIAEVIEDGSGGEAYFRWLIDGEEVKLKELVDSFPEEPFDYPGHEGETIKYTYDVYVEIMVNASIDERWWRRKCTGAFLFRLEGDTAEQYREIKAPPSDHERIRGILKDKYGDKLVEVINDRFNK